MGLIVLFDLDQVPRTVRRKEWYAAWRQVRIARREQKQHGERDRELLKTLPAGPYRRELIDRMVNPPILLGPYMDRPWTS